MAVKLKIDHKINYHHGDLENSLINAAISLVKKHGPNHLSLRAVCAEIGVSPSAAYHYFSDKTTLVDTVSRFLFEELASDQEKAINKIKGDDKKSAISRFRELGKKYIEWAISQPNLYRLVFGGYCNHLFEHEDSKAWNLLTQSLDNLFEKNVINKESRKDGEAFVWSSVHGVSSLIIEGFMPKEYYPIMLNRIEKSLGIMSK